LAILFGDVEGITTLFKICKQLNITIDAVVPSKKIWESNNLVQIQNLVKLDTSISLIAPQTEVIFNFINTHNTEIGIINSFDFILDRRIIENTRIRILNIHGGKLPEYRGANVLNWAIINGEEEIGITFHSVDNSIDTGPIIHELSLEIKENDTAFTLRERLCREIEVQLVSVLPLYIANKLPLKKQKSDNARYYKRRTPEDGLFDWGLSDRRIYNLIRALVHPWPGARYFNKKGQLVVIKEFMSLEEVANLRRIECG
jgi:methionyl-tRNA formyltransferase